jgi:hypothetical protein
MSYNMFEQIESMILRTPKDNLYGVLKPLIANKFDLVKGLDDKWDGGVIEKEPVQSYKNSQENVWAMMSKTALTIVDATGAAFVQLYLSGGDLSEWKLTKGQFQNAEAPHYIDRNTVYGGHVFQANYARVRNNF